MSPSEFVPPRRVLAEKAIRQRVSLAIRELDCIKADVESGKCGYHAVRARLLHLHGYLNDRREGYGAPAPAFRPLVALTPERDAFSELIRRDQLRIDLHWLASSNLTNNRFGYTGAAELALRALCSEGIGAAEANAFLAPLPSTKSIIREMGADRPRQIYCVWVCEPTLLETRATLWEGRNVHLRRLEDRRQSSQDARDRRGLKRMDLPKLCDLWLAEELSVIAYDQCRPSHEILTTVYRALTGDSSSRDAIIKRREKVHHYIRRLPRPANRSQWWWTDSMTVRRAERASNAAAMRFASLMF